MNWKEAQQQQTRIRWYGAGGSCQKLMLEVLHLEPASSKDQFLFSKEIIECALIIEKYLGRP